MRKSFICDNCIKEIPLENVIEDNLSQCPNCKTKTILKVFPAYFTEKKDGLIGDYIVTEDEASCYFHPEKKATVHCDICGRFLCDLCDIDFDESHICSSCLESGKKKGKLKNLEESRVLWDNIALSLAIYPLLLIYLSIITAPIALFFSIYHWKSKGSIIKRTKIRFIFAQLISVLTLVGWGAIIYVIIP